MNGLDVLFINVFPCGICGLHELSITGLKRLPINLYPRYFRESVDVTPESSLPRMNGLTPESAMNGLNSLNGLMALGLNQPSNTPSHDLSFENWTLSKNMSLCTMCAFNMNHGRIRRRWEGGWCLLK